MAKQTQRIESALRDITNLQSTEPAIINGVSPTRTGAIHRLLIQISDLEHENGHRVTTRCQEETNENTVVQKGVLMSMFAT